MIIQVGVVSYLGLQKANTNEVFIDETYSYIFSNSYDGNNISTIDPYWESWVDGDDFMEAITVQKGEKFAYDKVYYNNSFDCHPPLFYALLHTLCSLFVDQYSIWFGIVLNIILMLFADIFIYFLSKELINKKLISVLPVLLWGVTLACANMTLLIRMYMLLTVCTLGFTLFTVKCLKNNPDTKKYFGVFVFSLLGVFTHYYFIIYAFFVTLFYCLYRFINKEFKNGIIFGLNVSAAVALLLIIYPYAIEQATGSETNNVGNEVSRSILNFSTLPSKLFQFFHWITSSVFRDRMAGLLFLFALGLSVILLIKAIKSKSVLSVMKDKTFVSIIVFAIILLIITIASLHIAGKYANERYIYNLYPIYCILMICFVYKLIAMLEKKKVALLILSFIVIFNAAQFIINPYSDFIFYKDVEITQNIKNEHAENCIVINPVSSLTGNRSAIAPTKQLLLYPSFEKVFLTTGKSIKDFDAILEKTDYSKGVIVYIYTDTYWSEGYSAKYVLECALNSTDKFNSYKYITDSDFGSWYLLT